MPVFDITAPDGTKYEVTGPDGATEHDALAQVMKAHQAAPQQTVMQKIGDEVGGVARGIWDIPQSAIELGARGLDATGLTQNAYKNTHGAFEEMNNINQPTQSGFYKGGRIAGQILATLPLSEANVLKAPGFAAKLANGAAQGAAAGALTSASSDAPLSTQVGLGAAGGAALPMIGAVAKAGLGKVLPSVLGDLATGAGGASVKGAFNAGLAGGDAGQAFTDSMRGNTPWTDVVSQAKDALANMRAQRNTAYRSGMADVSKDATVLSFAPIDSAMADASKVKVFRGRSGTGPAQDLSKATSKVQGEVSDAVDNWKQLDPTEYHTPEGFDALKQQLGDIRDQYDYNTPQRLVADQAYNAVRKTIADQAPAYAKVMSGYSKASDAVSDIQKELSLGAKGNPATALRKLQSVMRDNANTSWGDRATKAGTLANNGAPNLLPSLAGQSLRSIAPRGLARYGDMAIAAAGGLTNPATLAALPLASPRVVGELAHGAGAGARHLGNLLNAGGLTLPRLKIAGRLSAPALGVLTPNLAR